MMPFLQELVRVVSSIVTPWVVLAPWESGIRIRIGRRVHKLEPGFNWVLPVIDRISVQTTRLRVCQLQMQTLSTRDGRTLMLCATVGYAIHDIVTLYDTLHHAEDTIKNVVADAIAQAVRNADSPTPVDIAAAATAGASRLCEYGLSNVSVALTDFAFVKCYRIASDQKWGNSGDQLTTSMYSTSQAPR